MRPGEAFLPRRDGPTGRGRPAHEDAEPLPDYRDDPVAYELEERARPDEMEMLRTAGRFATEVLDGFGSATAIDVCCGTGLSLEYLVAHPGAALVVGLDSSPEYLEWARAKYERLAAGEDPTQRLAFASDLAEHYRRAPAPPTLVHGDAVDADVGRDRFDLVMLASAYHHVEDARKLSLLRRVRRWIEPAGRAILAENVLPPYAPGDAAGYREAVTRFYSEVLKTARESDPRLPPRVEQLIERVARYGHDGDYEYKVSWEVLARHLQEAGLAVVRCSRVWPLSSASLPTDAGNFVFELSPMSTGSTARR